MAEISEFEKEKGKKNKNNYIFPDFIGKMMSKVDLRTQYEASMLSMSLMAVGLTITVVYFVIYFTFPLWYKIVLVINGISGVGFMWSNLVTTFQQYRNYMEIADFNKQMKGGENGKN